MAVTASIGGAAGFFGASDFFEWDISYDDATRNVTATGSGAQYFVVVTVQLTANLTRIVSFVPSAGAVSQDKAVAAAQAQAGVIEVVSDGQPHVLATNVNANQVSRLVSKNDPAGLPYSTVSSRT